MRILLACFVLTVVPTLASADVYVRDYYRGDGTYVQGHYRSDPDGIQSNNWSYPGNTNPYTGERAGSKSPYENGSDFGYGSSPSYDYDFNR
jgi:hypothetical protein